MAIVGTDLFFCWTSWKKKFFVSILRNFYRKKEISYIFEHYNLKDVWWGSLSGMYLANITPPLVGFDSVEEFILHKEKIYQLNQIELPTPKFYLFYNGRKNEPEQRQMKLSTAFKDFSGLELIVNFYNLNEGNNEDFLKRSKSLKSYCIFVNRVEKNLHEGMILEKAINEAINYCINADIMAEYLKTRRKEVVSMLGFEYDENLAKKAIADESREETKIEMVKNLLFAKTPLKYIVAATGWNEEKILEFAEKN